MIVTLQTERIRTIEQVAAFVEANEPVEFQPADRAGAYDFVSRTLARLGYRALDKPSKALVKRYLAKTTGYSRAPDLLGQAASAGEVDPRKGRLDRIAGAAGEFLDLDEQGAEVAVVAHHGDVVGNARGEVGDPSQTRRPQLKLTLGEQGALDGLLHYLIVFSMKPSVLAFSISVRTFARSSPDGTSASISSFRVTSLPGRVVSCSTTASTI